MEEYVTGDIVLLSHSKLGVMTSSSTVREIRGSDTALSRIVKKLTAKELAETLVDLMERYANLETKSTHLLKEGNTASTTNTTKTTTSYTKHTKSSKTTSSSEPKPKSINNDLDIPKTPNYGNHTISPRESTQHQYYGHQQSVHNTKTKLMQRGSDTPSASNTDTTNTSTISSLSPNININDMEQKKKTPKSKKKKLFKSIIKGNKSRNFLFKTKRKKEGNNKIQNKRSSSEESHHYIQQQYPHYYNEYPHIEYLPYPQEYMPYTHDQLPFSHIRSNPDHIRSNADDIRLHPHQITHNIDNNNAPKTRFSRSKSTDNYPYHSSVEQHHMHHRYHNPYFIAYTPSHNTNNSTTPPIPSPNQVNPYHPLHHAPYHHHYIHTPSTYPSMPTYPPYNRYNLHFHPHHYYCSTPNIEEIEDTNDKDKLIDVLLSVPHKKDKKKKSHPISYKKRTIKHGNNNDGSHSLMSSRTALTSSVSPSQSDIQQQYTHNHDQMILDLLNSPEPQINAVDPIIANYHHINNRSNHSKHLQNRSNTMDTESREYNNNYYIENSYKSMDKKNIMNQYMSSATHNNDSMISIRGGSHSPRNSSYSSYRRGRYHNKHQRPFSATNKHNYFDFGANKQRIYHNKHSKSNTNTIFSEIEGKNEYSSQNKTAAIKPFHPQTKYATKPKLTQHNYSNPVQHNILTQMQYHKERGKTMGNDINLTELGVNLNENRWYITSDLSSNDDDEEEETEDIRDIETVIRKSQSNNEGRKSQSFSVLGKSQDDMTPLVLSPQSKKNKRAHHRSQSVANIFDPMKPSFLSDLYKKKEKETEGKTYRIALSKEDSNKAWHMQDNLTPNNSNKLIAKPRISESFTPTISQTPSYLREEIKWDKSMTAKISQTTASSQCSTESDDKWMLHNQININGNNVAAFWEDHDDDSFPNIEEDHDNDIDSSTTKVSHHDIANKDELEKIMQISRKYIKNQLSPTTNTSDTDTISKSYIY